MVDKLPTSDEILNMYVQQTITGNVFENNQYTIRRVTSHTFELLEYSWLGNMEIYHSSYGYKEVDKLLEVLDEKV
ncbi:hypothetical protein VPBG_00238 [Vibrio phage helene 12B3]|uniref:hypothetical protein n=1 Tax=Vibrio phage helene 12B3 TaxID=573173 RepID=UPI0002C05269|nr:hypothetical protein VPBG_00238 [Vibrio phage helene 12B3]AGG58010.1 hypothetical protein VPBG_00238 [Vibrio phage helene 12B3]